MLSKYLFLSVLFASFLLNGCGGGEVSGEVPPSGGSGVATLTWSKPIQNTDNSDLTDLEGFYVYYGDEDEYLSDPSEFKPFRLYVDNTASSQYMACQNLEGSTKMQCIIDKLDIGTNWYFSVTAVNSLGIEGSRSNIACKKFKSSNCLS